MRTESGLAAVQTTPTWNSSSMLVSAYIPLWVDKARRWCLPGNKVQTRLSQCCLNIDNNNKNNDNQRRVSERRQQRGCLILCVQHPLSMARPSSGFTTRRGHAIAHRVFVLLPSPLCIPTAPRSRVTFPKVLPNGRDAQSFPSWYSLWRPHASQSIISCVCLRKQRIYCSDHCCFKRKVFSLCGIGGLSLLLGSQYNYQRLQAVLLPGMEWLSQGYYYFHAELFGSLTQHLNNLVYEAWESKKKEKEREKTGARLSLLLHIGSSAALVCEETALGVVVSSAMESIEQSRRLRRSA